MEHRWTPSLSTLGSLADAPEGRDPFTPLVEDSSGNLFGSTSYGGAYGGGTLFVIPAGSSSITTLANFNPASGTAGPVGNLVLDSSGNLFGIAGNVFEWFHDTGSLTTLATFTGANGDYPNSLVEDSSGNLFGTTNDGGASNYGTVFEVAKGSSTVTTLATFDDVNGGTPNGGLIEDASGDLFGTEQLAGDHSNGGVFELVHGSATPTTVVGFDWSNGGSPVPSLVQDANGDIFGSTITGGAADGGTVFEIASGSHAFTTLVNFDATKDDGVGSLSICADGDLIGTVDQNNGYPIVFQLTPGSLGLTTLATFSSVVPGTPCALTEDSIGNLFGVGGGYFKNMVFEITKGSGVPTPVVIFPEVTGYDAQASLAQDSNGDLFGTAYQGGTFNDGTVFEVPHGTGTVSVLASFNGANGQNPFGGVVLDTSGNLYGTTVVGGAYGNGTVFEVRAGSNAITTIASFHGYDGAGPDDTLFMDSAGSLFGTTASGGAYGYGTAFEIIKGNNTIITLASFSASGLAGFSPNGLLEDSSGNLFGTTAAGGANGDLGAVFEIPQGGGNATMLAYFLQNGEANSPNGLIEDSNGDLYGTTADGAFGASATVFEVPKGSSTIHILAKLPNQGLVSPNLVVDASGNVFGTTAYGGAYGDGSAFEIQKGSGTVTTLVSFNSTNGSNPLGGLIAGSAGNLFGATSAGGASGDGTVFEVTPPPVTLPGGTAGTAYKETVPASGGTGSLTFSETGPLPTGLALSITGVLAGTPLTTGSFTFTVTATDSVGASTSQQYLLEINPGPLSQYLVTVAPTVQAGAGFLASFQAADRYGNPITGYSGPMTLTPSITPSGGTSSLPAAVSISPTGVGFFLATVQTAGTYTITVSGGSYSGSSSPFTATAGPPVKLAFAATPGNTPTGVPLAPVSVQVQDLYGNVVTGDSSDIVTLAVAAGPGFFASGSTLTATVHNGVATFNNLVLVTPGTYQLSAVVPGLYTGPNSASFSVLPLQVVPDSFQGTPSGFSLQLNAPFLVNAVTPAMYGSGAMVTPTVTLTQTSGTPPVGATLPYPVPGSLLVDLTSNSLTFVETDTSSLVGNGTPLLPDGVYVVDVFSSGANGLQALNRGGGYLDGTNSGTPGQDYTATFTVGAAAAGEDVLWVPATADGPGQALSAPGKNQAAGGYPIYLDDRSGSVTDVQATLNYNPTLLNVFPSSSATFTVTVPSPGTALLHYHGSALAVGVQTPIGFLTASVPAGTASNPVPYKAKDLLTLSAVSLNGGTLAAVGAEALHLVAYVGDADGNGSYSSNDAVLTTRVALQTDTGFAAYPLVDPVIVADTDGSGFIPADAALQVNEAGIGAPTANLAIPPIPSGVHFLARAASLRPLVRASTPSAPPVGVSRVPSQVSLAWLDQAFAQAAEEASLFADSCDGFTLTAKHGSRARKRLL